MYRSNLWSQYNSCDATLLATVTNWTQARVDRRSCVQVDASTRRKVEHVQLQATAELAVVGERKGR